MNRMWRAVDVSPPLVWATEWATYVVRSPAARLMLTGILMADCYNAILLSPPSIETI